MSRAAQPPRGRPGLRIEAVDAAGPELHLDPWLRTPWTAAEEERLPGGPRRAGRASETTLLASLARAERALGEFWGRMRRACPGLAEATAWRLALGEAAALLRLFGSSLRPRDLALLVQAHSSKPMEMANGAPWHPPTPRAHAEIGIFLALRLVRPHAPDWPSPAINPGRATAEAGSRATPFPATLNPGQDTPPDPTLLTLHAAFARRLASRREAPSDPLSAARLVLALSRTAIPRDRSRLVLPWVSALASTAVGGEALFNLFRDTPRARLDWLDAVGGGARAGLATLATLERWHELALSTIGLHATAQTRLALAALLRDGAHSAPSLARASGITRQGALALLKRLRVMGFITEAARSGRQRSWCCVLD